MNLLKSFQNRNWPAWFADVFAFLGSLLYLGQALVYAHTTNSGLDEGSYLYKGYLFVTGVYQPFQPYGPLTNKAPLAFLIPGMAEFILGPGLRTGRYFAISLGLLAVLGTWISARRWGGKWLAAGAVWAFVLSPLVIKIHAITDSEVIIASMLAWICVLAVGEKRPAWQVMLGAALAALTILTRQNMVVVLPLFVLYVFWQHGKKLGLWSAAVGGLVLLAGHAAYWPNILTIWAPWLPDNLTPFLDPFRLPDDVVPIWQPSIDLGNRILAFFLGIRYHFISVVGALSALFLWSRPRDWKSTPVMRAGIFLAVLYLLLFVMHAWAAVASQYESYSCVFCLESYLTFFDPLGILLLVISIAGSWKRNPALIWQVAAVLFVVVFSAGIGLSAFENVDGALLNLPVPRVRDGRFQPGFATLAGLLENKFALPPVLIKKYIALSLGLIAGIGILALSWILWRGSKRSGSNAGFGYVLLNSYLAVGLILSPFLSIGSSRRDCSMDVIAANEEIGRHLAGVIPADSLVYWDAGLSFAPLSYVRGIGIFPPQINDGYTYQIGGNSDVLYRFSHWNEELSGQWIEQADVFIVEDRKFSNWKGYLDSQDFEEYQRPASAPSCEEGAGIRIFHRLP